MAGTRPRTGPHPDEANKKNEREASEADKRTVDNVQKNESDKEKTAR